MYRLGDPEHSLYLPLACCGGGRSNLYSTEALQASKSSEPISTNQKLSRTPPEFFFNNQNNKRTKKNNNVGKKN